MVHLTYDPYGFTKPRAFAFDIVVVLLSDVKMAPSYLGTC